MAERSRLLLTVATVLVFTPFGNVAHGQCITSPINVVVYEGAKNTILSCGLGPSAERWTVRPTSKAATELPITIFTNNVSSDLTGLYGISQSGLLIRSATINTTPGPISTAGVYSVNLKDKSKVAVKLVVIRSGPDCSFAQSVARIITITCTIIYADHPVGPMNATISCLTGGRVYTGPTKKTLISVSQYLWSSKATIIVTDSSVASFDCKAAFTAPFNELSYLAKNPPNFTANITGQRPSGSLTRKPNNTAAVDGSMNITLECASIYGPDAIIWSFNELGSVSNAIIQISIGDQLFETYEQKYDLQTTVNSSQLIVRQLSTETDGTYFCYDGVESASALLLVIPFSISMDPLFGPVAGGTNITITGSASNVGSNIPGIRDASKVYFGNNLSATFVSKVNGSSLVAVAPTTTAASIGHPLPIIIEISSTLYGITKFNMTFNTTFTYLPNPEITGINPNSSIVDGGILIDVTGKSLSSVAKPIIQLTVFVYGATESGLTSNTAPTLTSRVCTFPTGSDSYMQCPMPPVTLPDDVLAILNSRYKTSTGRSKRSIMPNDINRALALTGSNDQVDIYLGFALDGYKKYENINDALPDTRLIFYSAPEINSSNELIEFDPSKDELINITGRYMMRGCRLRDYLVHIGNVTCNNSDLQDNQLSCRPPKVEPSSTVDDTNHCGQHLSITITVGYKQYGYACLAYTGLPTTLSVHSGNSGENTGHPTTVQVPLNVYSGNSGENKVPLIVGLTVGLIVFANILIIVVVICILRYRRQKSIQDSLGLQSFGEQEPGYSNNAVFSLHRPPSVLFWRKKGVEGVDDDANSQSHNEYYPRRRQEEADDNLSVSEEFNPRFRQEGNRNSSANDDSENHNNTVNALYRPRSLFFRRKGVNNADNDAYEQSQEEYYPRRRQDDDGDMIADEEYLDNFERFVSHS